MNSRLNKFYSFKDHAWLKKSYSKLSNTSIELAEDFLRINESLNKDDFEFKVNRLFLDNSNKPKEWVVITELLSNSNS